jgi:hypothetical protein
MNNFVDFCSYFNNDNNESTRFYDIAAFKNYYNAYSNYLVARKYNLEDIKKYRMNSVIDYFMQINMLSDTYRDELRLYYLKHINDDYNRTLNPPRCPFYLEEKLKREQAQQEEYENETDEVKQHYRELDAKSTYLVRLNYKLTHADEGNDIVCDTCDEYCDWTSTSSEANDYYDEYCDDYDNDNIDIYDNCDNYDDDDYDDDYY